ncbi:MAG TPA: hypothetical protein PK014_12270 [Thermoanaerobaculia bacterium]|nr:hypothetical protein [Thermoanaerobaculia bacterium]HUM30844.1 hypothetical protein [Thermoanaerobaculia bacterium]HXK69175.1 hypothetical protein [Thermoanaerobaculia bacterium]
MGKALILSSLLLFPAILFGGSDVFSVGTPVTLTEPTKGDVTVFWASADVNTRVKGNLTVVGGPLILGESAVVEGDVVVVFGVLTASTRAIVTGERVTVGATLFTGAEQLSPKSLVFLLLLWLALGLALLAGFPQHVSLGAQLVLTHPGRVLLSGILFLACGSVMLMLGFLLSGLYIGFPVILLVAFSLMGAKIYGCTLLIYAFGRILVGEKHALITFISGILLIFALRLIPVAGPVIWSFLTLPALGITLLQVTRSRVHRRSLFSPPVLIRSS